MSEFTISDWPRLRNLGVEHFKIANATPNIHGLFEVDITLFLQRLNEQRATGKPYSYTASILYYLAQALGTNKSLLSLRYGRRKRICFDDVDIITFVERKAAGQPGYPVGLTIRGADKKTLAQINAEYRATKEVDDTNATQTNDVKRRRALLRYPPFIIRWFLKRIHKNPFLFKKYYGNAGLTSLNFFGNNMLWHGIPVSSAPVTLTVTGNYKKVVLYEGEFQERTYGCFTFTINHSLIDGAPAVRLCNQFIELIENASGFAS